MRPRPDGDAKSPHSTNYDLAKANVYPKLPDPLVFKNGRPVKNAADWGGANEGDPRGFRSRRFWGGRRTRCQL